MTDEVLVETPQEECERLAQRLIQVDRKNGLLRYFYQPKDGPEWRQIRSDFFRDFAPEGVSEDECVGQYLDEFHQKLAGALRQALLKNGIRNP